MKMTNNKPIMKTDLALAGLVFLLGMGLYVRTLAPGLLLGDSGEFQLLASTLGIAHNTGYPIYLLIGKLISWLPFQTVAYKVNLLSALAGAVTLSEVYLLAKILTGRRLLSLVSPLVLGINAIFWWHAVIAEVYTPAAAFAGGVLLLVVLWGKTYQPGYLFSAGLVGGLSLGIHGLVPLAAPAVLFYLVLQKADRKAWISALAGGLAGLLIFTVSFFALDAHNDPTGMPATFRVHASAYGLQPEDFDSPFTRIGFIFFSRQWRRQMFSGTAADVNSNIQTYLDRTMSTFGMVFFFIALMGAISLFSRKVGKEIRRREGLLLLGSWLGMAIFLANYRVGDLEVFFIPLYVVVAILVSEGLASLADDIDAFSRAFHVRKQFCATMGSLVILGVCLWAALPFRETVLKSLQQGRITFLDKWRMYYPYPVLDPGYPYREAKKIADKVEDNAILFLDWDMLYPVSYVAHVEEHHTGIACYECLPFGTNGRFASSAIKFVRQNIDQRPIYFSTIPENIKGLYEFKQVGWTRPLYKAEECTYSTSPIGVIFGKTFTVTQEVE
jgi:hypothetical protein